MPVPRIFIVAVAAAALLHADSKKAKEDQHIELLRGLTAEWATMRVYLPRSRKALDFDALTGTWDERKWKEVGDELGPVGKVGDMVQVTKVEIQKDAIILQINDGVNGKTHWYDKVQVDSGGGTGGGVSPVGNVPDQTAVGTNIAVRFKGGIGDISSKDVKRALAPVLDFEKHSVTGQIEDELPPEIKKAVLAKKAIEGMTRDQVVLALGRTGNKIRETHDGVETEDWIYGEAPGRVTFVTFIGDKVIKVKETYAGLGGSVAEIPNQ